MPLSKIENKNSYGGIFAIEKKRDYIICGFHMDDRCRLQVFKEIREKLTSVGITNGSEKGDESTKYITILFRGGKYNFFNYDKLSRSDAHVIEVEQFFDLFSKGVFFGTGTTISKIIDDYINSEPRRIYAELKDVFEKIKAAEHSLTDVKNTPPQVPCPKCKKIMSTTPICCSCGLIPLAEPSFGG